MQKQKPQRESKRDSKLPPIQGVPKKNKKRDKRQQDRNKQLRLDEIINEKAIKYMRQDTLKITNIKGRKYIVETDRLFVDSVRSVCQAQQTVFIDFSGDKQHQLTEEECDQIHYRAKLHRRANMVNINTSLTKKNIQSQPALKSLYCKCGCGRFKGSSYDVCQDMQNLSFLGSGILLFFLLIKGLVLNIFIMFAAYCLYAVITYAGGTLYSTNNPGLCSTAFCQFKNKFSSYNQADPNTTFFILDWIGLAVMVLWIFITRLVKCYGFYMDTMIDKNLKSASDFAVKIDNLPIGGYSEYELFEFFEQQYERRKNMNPKDIAQDIMEFSEGLVPEDKSKIIPANEGSNLSEQAFVSKNQKKGVSDLREQKESSTIKDENEQENHFKIRSIQIIYKMQFSRKIIGKIIQSCQWINRLIKQYEGDFVIDSKDEYLARKKDIIQIYETLEDLRKKFLNDSAFRQKIATHSAIVQFQKEEDMKKVQRCLGHQNLTLYKKIKEKINECIWGSSSAMFKGEIPDIIRAPQPSDIHWENCEKEFSYMRIFGIYFATFVVIMISLGIIAGVQAIQFQLTQDNSASPSTLVTVLNVVASIVLTVVNAVLWVLLKNLLVYQYNHTVTNKITSLMGKASFATWINIILIPIVVNYLIYDKYYGSEGVAGMVIDYQVAALAASLPLILFNPVEVITNVILKIRCIRNYVIKIKYKKKAGNIDGKLLKDQLKKVYQFYEPPEFVIEEAYVFILPNIMQALFFCQLQPILLVFAFAQAFLFYWVCKIKVLKISKIPVLIDRLVFQVAVYHVMMAPIFYGVGSIYNSYVSSRINPNVSFSFIGSAICVGLGLLNYFNPGNIFQKIVDLIANCFPCLNKETVYKQLKQNAEKNKGDENSNLVAIRSQNYYRNSNSLHLMGFQKAIKGQTNSDQIVKQLQSFCQSHVGSSGVMNKDEDNFNLSQEEKQFDRVESKYVANIFE